SDPDRYNREIRLTHGAVIAKELMKVIMHKSEHEVSFGIATNKLRAKISCGLNKPKGITIMPYAYMRVLDTLRFENLPGCGGRTRKVLREKYQIDTLWHVLVLCTDSLEMKIKRTNKVEGPRAVANDVVRKAQLLDDEIVRKCYFTKSTS
ncbi:unnamed protein product, partial [Allacma fusca]